MRRADSKSFKMSLFERMMIVFAVMLASILVLLDMTVVNVSLPNIMQGVGAGQSKITWIITGYIIASAVTMPLTGYLNGVIGRRKLLMFSILGFFITSILCGLSHTFTQIVFFRIFQGISGAALIPLSQYILFDIYPKEEHHKAMAIWGAGFMIAPILGLTLGGYITEFIGWRWIFYLNAPFCVLSLVIADKFIKDSERDKRSFDRTGFFLLVIFIGSFQLFLDRGGAYGWFESKLVTVIFLVFLFSGMFFINRCIENKVSIIKISIFRDRNFLLSIIVGFTYCMYIFGVMTMLPLMVSGILKYTPKYVGIVISPRAISAGIGMALAPFLSKRINVKVLMLIGLFLSFYGTFQLAGFDLLNTSGADLLVSNILQGVGSGLFFVPLSVIAVSNLNKKDIAESSGVYSLARSLGGAVGISIANAFVVNQISKNWQLLSTFIQVTNENYQRFLSIFRGTQININAIITHMVAEQSMVLGFLHFYRFVSVLLIPAAFFVFLFKTKISK